MNCFFFFIINKVELSLRHTQENKNCLVLSSEILYAYCGHAATKRQKKATKELVKIMRKRRNDDIKYVEIFRSKYLFASMTAVD